MQSAEQDAASPSIQGTKSGSIQLVMQLEGRVGFRKASTLAEIPMLDEAVLYKRTSSRNDDES